MVCIRSVDLDLDSTTAHFAVCTASYIKAESCCGEIVPRMDGWKVYLVIGLIVAVSSMLWPHHSLVALILL